MQGQGRKNELQSMGNCGILGESIFSAFKKGRGVYGRGKAFGPSGA
jgi:hypothetical protein